MAATGGNAQLMTGGTGVQLTIPANFAVDDAQFQLKQLSSGAVLTVAGTPADRSLIKPYIYDFKAFAALDTVTSNFDEPITVTMQYGDSDVTNYNMSTLAIYRWDGAKLESAK